MLDAVKRLLGSPVEGSGVSVGLAAPPPAGLLACVGGSGGICGVVL